MAHHLIFVPKEHEGDRGKLHPLEAVGLADHAPGVESIPIGDGPDGAGTLCAWRDNGANQRMHFAADQQTWLPAVAHGDLPEKRYWVGVWNDAPPVESDLRRNGILHGQDVPLVSGQWHIPAPEFLPHNLVLDDRGELIREPKAAYQEIALESQRWRARLASEPQLIPYIELFDFGLRCLSLNYRLPRELASHLRLIDEDNIKKVLFATLGREYTDGE